MGQFNPYEVLGVETDATALELKVAYKRASKRHHPDVSGGSDAAFTRVKQAYDILRDPKRRKAYDDGGVTEEVVDHTQHILMEMFNKALSMRFETSNDILAAVYNMVFTTEDSIKDSIKGLEDELEYLSRLRGKFKKVDGGDSPFEDMIVARISEASPKLSSARASIAHVERLYAELAEYGVTEGGADDPEDTMRQMYKKMKGRGGGLRW